VRACESMFFFSSVLIGSLLVHQYSPNRYPFEAAIGQLELQAGTETEAEVRVVKVTEYLT
jgi:hypothetical protein